MTGIAVISSVFFGAYRIISANRKQTNNKIEHVESYLMSNMEKMDNKKVDVKLFEQTICSVEDKIDTNDRTTNKQLDKMDKKLDRLIELHMNRSK